MRALVVTAVLLAFACSPKSEEKQPAPPTPAQLASPASGALIDAQAIIGVWSFDQSCASGDGMILSADGSASLDEGSSGTWRVDQSGRLVLDLITQEPGMDPVPNAPHESKTFEASAPVGDHLVGTLDPDGRAIDALRCPSAPQ